jgi:hypothetical protein
LPIADFAIRLGDLMIVHGGESLTQSAIDSPNHPNREIAKQSPNRQSSIGNVPYHPSATTLTSLLDK